MREIKFLKKNRDLYISLFHESYNQIQTVKLDLYQEYEVKDSVLYQDGKKIFEFKSNQEIRDFYKYTTKKEGIDGSTLIFIAFVMTLFSIIFMFSIYEYTNYKSKQNIQQNSQFQLKQQELIKNALLPSLLGNIQATTGATNINQTQVPQAGLSLDMLNELSSIDNLPNYLKPKDLEQQKRQNQQVLQQNQVKTEQNNINQNDENVSTTTPTNKSDDDFRNEIKNLKN